MRYISEKKSYRKIETLTLCSITLFFLPKVVPFMGWFRKKMVGPDKPQMAKNNAAHQNCMLDKYGYKHTLRISTTMYRVSQEECARLREGVPYVKVCNPGPPTCYIRTIHHIAVTTVLCSWRLANYCPKHVELIRRSIKLLLLHLVGHLYRVSQEEWTKLRESVPYVELYRYNPKHLYPKLNGYGDNGQRSLKLWQLLLTYWLPNTY